MTLVNRLSILFLAALAIYLAGYSLLCYVLIRDHLYSQFDQQLRGALNVLAAAVEVENDGVKWQPSDHAIELGGAADAAGVRWLLTDEQGRQIDHSRNLQATSTDDAELLRLTQTQPLSFSPPTSEVTGSVGSWRYLQKRLLATQPKPESERDADEFAAVVVTVARTSSALHSELWRLATLVCVLPLALWILAVVVGRWFCRRALAPVSSMASQARSMTQADFKMRLPVAARRDELAELAASFNALLNRLQQAFDQQRRFTGDAAHQLRTPLTVLRGEIDVALRRPRSDDEYRNVLAALRCQTEELQQLVESLLFLARADSDSIPPETRVVALAQWLPEYLASWRARPRGADITLQIDPQAQAITSPPLLAQALGNLLGNALKYSPGGGPVTVRVKRAAELVAIEVDDQGMGVALAERTAIFEPFYRSAEARRSGVEGIGLGLTLVARIAQALGGRIECNEKQTPGSRFTLWLPAAD